MYKCHGAPTNAPAVIVATNSYAYKTNAMTTWADDLSRSKHALHYITPDGQLVIDATLYGYYISLAPYDTNDMAQFRFAAENPPLWIMSTNTANQFMILDRQLKSRSVR